MGEGKRILAGRGEGSVDEKRASELDKVEGGRQFAAFAVQVRLHVRQAVVGLLLGQVLEDMGEGEER